jgi:hypothetical protein
MLVGPSTLNPVVLLLGEGISKYQIPSHFGHHSCLRSARGMASRVLAQKSPKLRRAAQC